MATYLRRAMVYHIISSYANLFTSIDDKMGRLIICTKLSKIHKLTFPTLLKFEADTRGISVFLFLAKESRA